MNPFAHTTWWVVGGCTLFHFLWAGALIGVLALPVRRLLPQDAFRARYVFGLFVLVCLMVLAPLLGWRVVNQIERRSRAALIVDAVEELPDVMHHSGTLSAASLVRDSVPGAVAEHPSRLAGVMGSVLARAVPWLVSLWAVGTSFMILSLLAGLIHAARLRRKARVSEQGPPHDVCRALASRLGLRPVPVGVCAEIDSPVLVGFLRPVILLPAANLGAWSRHELEMVLLHELSHVRRHDNLVNLAQRFVEALLFFQPAVWFVSRWIRADREECCDAAVIQWTGCPFEYAQMLVQLAGQPRSVRLAVAMGEHNLVGRVRRILRPAERRPRGLLRTVASGCVLLLSGPAVAALWQVGLVVPDQVSIDPQLLSLGSSKSHAVALEVTGSGGNPRNALIPWWAAAGSKKGTTLRLVDPNGDPVADAQLWIRAKWTPTGPDLRPGENRDPLVSDANGIIRIDDPKVLRPLKECDPTVPAYIIEPSGRYAAAINLTPADWGRDLQLVMEPLRLVRVAMSYPETLPDGRRMTWTKAFIQIPGSSISYLLRQTGDTAGQFHYLLPPGRYQLLAFAGSDDPNDACSVNYLETDTTVVPFEVVSGQTELDLTPIRLRLARNPKPYGNNPTIGK